MRYEPITHAAGERFGRLVILREDPQRAARSGSVRWICQCDCGAVTSAVGASLRRGNTVSCGCRQRETGAEHNRKHGLADRIPEYYVWNTMRRRCTDARNAHFQDYGGRGIVVCPEWDDFARFYADMGSRPSREHSIDRIDNDGPYSPENCRWATRAEQANNRRSNIWLTHEGRTMRLLDWEAATGIRADVIAGRLRIGWSAARALTQAPRRSPTTSRRRTGADELLSDSAHLSDTRQPLLL